MNRFFTMSDVAKMLQLSPTATYKLLRDGEIPAIKVGGRGQWRIEEAKLEEFINSKYVQTQELVEGRDRKT